MQERRIFIWPADSKAEVLHYDHTFLTQYGSEV